MNRVFVRRSGSSLCARRARASRPLAARRQACAAARRGEPPRRRRRACIATRRSRPSTACPNNGPQRSTSRATARQPQVNFHSAPPPADLKKRDQQTKPNMPTSRCRRHARRAARAACKRAPRRCSSPRSSGLESSTESTPANAPDRIRARCAASPRTTSSSRTRRSARRPRPRSSATTSRRRTRARRASSRPSPTQRKTTIMTVAQGGDRLLHARRRLLRSSVDNVPEPADVPAARRGPLLPRLRVRAGERQRRTRGASTTSSSQKTPNSKYIPNAYLAFGELFFNEAQGDPSKWELAKQAYMKVIGYPPPNNKVYGYAWYKLAYVFWNKGELRQGAQRVQEDDRLRRARTRSSRTRRSSPRARARTSSRSTRSKGDPTRRLQLLPQPLGDAAGTNDKTFKMMDDLGQNYLDTGHYPEAIALYKDLMVRDRGERQELRLPGAHHRSDDGDEVRQQGRHRERARQPGQGLQRRTRTASHTADAKQECANKTAALLTETAMAWHLEAVGSQGQRGTGDPKTMDLAALPLQEGGRHLERGRSSRSSSSRASSRKTGPTIYKIKYAMADLLYFQREVGGVRPGVRRGRRGEPEGARGGRGRVRAVLCYQNIYLAHAPRAADRKGTRQPPGRRQEDAKEDADDKLPPEGHDRRPEGDDPAFNRYICYIQPGHERRRRARSSSSRSSTRAARTYFEAQHWEEAAPAFRDIAMNNSDNDVGIYAAQLYLESINVLDVPRERRTAPVVLRRHGDGRAEVHRARTAPATRSQKNEEQCTHAHQDPVRHPAPQARRSSSRTPTRAATNALAALREGRQGVLRALGEVRRDAAPQQPAAAVRAAATRSSTTPPRVPGRRASSRRRSRARMVLLNPQYRMEKTELAEGRDVRDRRQLPGHRRLRPGGRLVRAVRARHEAERRRTRRQGARATPSSSASGSARRTQAIADAKQFQRGLRRARSRRRRRDRVRHRRALRRQGGLGERAQGAPGRDGHSSTRRRRTSRCRRTRRSRARSCTSRPTTRRKRRVRQGPQALGRPARGAGEDRRRLQGRGRRLEARKRLGKALDAVGEAMLLRRRGDASSDKVDSIPFPVYKGPGTKDDVLKHIGQEVKPWYTKKQDGHRGGRQGVPEDHRAPAGAAAALGHRGRLARRADVGQLRRRLPRGALSRRSGTRRASSRARATRSPGTRSRRLPRAPRRGVEPFKSEQGEAGAQDAASTTR